jgi:hypothetical protein
MKTKHLVTLAIVLASVLILPVGANAVLHNDSFDVMVNSQGTVVGGGGSGGAQWYYYPNNNWWNIWFYDDPLKLDPAYKIVDFSMTISPLDPTVPSQFQMTLNWTKPAWSPNPDSPPLPPLTPEQESLFIGRDTNPLITLVYSFTNKSFDLGAQGYVLPIPYNPEWVSIDIRGFNFEITNGLISHECIPEPATMALFGLGALGLLRKRRA